MNATGLDQLQSRYSALLLLLPTAGAVPHYQSRLPTRPTNNGDAHVERLDGALHYVVTERGAELHRRVARDEDELLYWLMENVTWSLSNRMRQPWLSRLLGRDPRRHRFATHVKLLETLDPSWADRRRRHHAELLERYPFRDRS
ncbi:Imm63 family immunity protein [Arenimonas sp. MALMAid1274]|uniref:Imm63 family immunity protein n=1 Tax=Arenimonas sp. MALMAid1274 TaxID=3411630 RepID=UPI003BA02D78